ncbi:class I SAM-dependent methyltransferase [Shewanella sp. SR44-3]|uniref:class I SAM-dependent methyltransferase n=1 Tax=Shewanella sp. SR44-3 TaxID=2760936 RepID=UPI0015FAAE94|nr:class I SAM-dependent methyltransferase [Shewanella sp. SR44-3]MBB1270416.1 class I SAM-dependent methyltransferase [Shewanella sp. SR44-3]
MNITSNTLTLAAMGVLLGLISTATMAHADGHLTAATQGVNVNTQLMAAVNSSVRKKDNTLRDQYRHPAETLAFFDVKPTDTVIELWPGTGWYTEILAPYLAKQGHYVAAGFETEPKQDTPGNNFRAKAGKAYQAWLTDNKAQLGPVHNVVLDPPSRLTLGTPESADVVLTFRNLHNWAMQDQLEGVFTAAYQVLKSGGTFGVVEHRAKPGMKAESGYMDQAAMVALANKVGFSLTDSSEVNANPKDTKDHPKGVWTLPPRLALDAQDKAKYLAIGESDRMTLKFIKVAR